MPENKSAPGGRDVLPREAHYGMVRDLPSGWVSEGWTPEAAQRRRHELLEQDRAGEYKPKKERKAEQLTFGELMEKHYLPWAEKHKKHAFGDLSGDFLVLETKGQDTQQDRTKREFLDEWVRAVNAHGGFGKWKWAVSTNPADLRGILEAAATVAG